MKLWTVKEAAARLGRHPVTVARAIRKGTLKATRLQPHGPYFIPESELERIEGR